MYDKTITNTSWEKSPDHTTAESDSAEESGVSSSSGVCTYSTGAGVVCWLLAAAFRTLCRVMPLPSGLIVLVAGFGFGHYLQKITSSAGSRIVVLTRGEGFR